MESGPFTGLRLCLLIGAANAFRVSLALNTYTSVELAYATSYVLYRTQRHLDPGKQLVVERFRHALPDDAQWRAALAALGSKQAVIRGNVALL